MMLDVSLAHHEQLMGLHDLIDTIRLQYARALM